MFHSASMRESRFRQSLGNIKRALHISLLTSPPVLASTSSLATPSPPFPLLLFSSCLLPLLLLPAVSHPLRGKARLCVTSLEWVKLSFLALIKALISMVHNNIHSLMSIFLDPIFFLYSRAGKHFMIDMVAISIGWVRSAAMCCYWRLWNTAFWLAESIEFRSIAVALL